MQDGKHREIVRGGQPAQQRHDLTCRLGIETRHRLVGEQDARRWASARAIATRCCWPPDSVPARCAANSTSPTSPRKPKGGIEFGAGQQP